MNNTTNLDQLCAAHAQHIGGGRQDEPAGAPEHSAGCAGQPTGGGATPVVEEDIMQVLRGLEFDVCNPPPAERCLFTANGVPIMHQGNVSTTTAVAKGGKTAYLAAAQASVMGCAGDFLGWHGDGNPAAGAVVAFDTEQSAGDHHNVVANRILTRARLLVPPAWFKSYRVRTLSLKQRRAALLRALDVHASEFGSVHSVWLDGVAEFVRNVNDESESSDYCDELAGLAERYHCGIMCVLHRNPGEKGQGGKMRGHLGSYLERKSETVLNLQKDNSGITTVTTSYARRAPLAGDDAVRFRFCQDAGMHVLVTQAEVAQARAQQNNLIGILRAVWGPDPEWTGRQAEVLSRMPEGSETTQKRRLTELVRLDWIQHPSGIYSLRPAGRSQVHPAAQPADEDVIPFAQAA